MEGRNLWRHQYDPSFPFLPIPFLKFSVCPVISRLSYTTAVARQSIRNLKFSFGYQSVFRLAIDAHTTKAIVVDGVRVVG